MQLETTRFRAELVGAGLTWVKVTLWGNLEEEDEGRREGPQMGPRLTLKESGKGGRSSSSPERWATTVSCDRKCLMFCLAAWTRCWSSSTPRMWEGLNFRATASVM